MRLIDADEVQKRIDMMGTVNGILCWDAHDFIDHVPTIEAEPVRHGRWIRRETVLDTECKCSVCGYKDFVPKHDNYWFRRKFCPNCGAKMDGVING